MSSDDDARLPMRCTPIAAMVEASLAAGATNESVVRAIETAEMQSKRSRTPAEYRLRGFPLPDDWVPSIVDIEFARFEGLSDEQIKREAEKFRDYWPNAPAGRRAKRDWAATWRNWIRRAVDDLRHSRPSGGHGYGTHRRSGGFALNSIALTCRHLSSDRS